MRRERLAALSAARNPDALDAMQVAVVCGWTVSTLYRRMEAGDAPPSYKVGRYRRWNQAELERWLAKRRRSVR